MKPTLLSPLSKALTNSTSEEIAEGIVSSPRSPWWSVPQLPLQMRADYRSPPGSPDARNYYPHRERFNPRNHCPDILDGDLTMQVTVDSGKAGCSASQ